MRPIVHELIPKDVASLCTQRSVMSLLVAASNDGAGGVSGCCRSATGRTHLLWSFMWYFSTFVCVQFFSLVYFLLLLCCSLFVHSKLSRNRRRFSRPVRCRRVGIWLVGSFKPNHRWGYVACGEDVVKCLWDNGQSSSVWCRLFRLWTFPGRKSRGYPNQLSMGVGGLPSLLSWPR